MMRSWFDRRQDENVLFLTYENIVSNKQESILQIAKFLSEDSDDADDLDLVSKLKHDDGRLIEQILLYSSVTNMKKDPLRWCSERQAKFTPFIRKGQNGSWGELLTDDQVQQLDDMTRRFFDEDELKELGESYYSTTVHMNIHKT